MVRWLLIRHGAHLDRQLGKHGQAQVDRLAAALALREDEPALYLISGRPQAQATFGRLIRTRSLDAPCANSEALTPGGAAAGLDALVRSAPKELWSAPCSR